jgi:hypothetical protein
MTDNQILSHAEQMEALRKEFQALWAEEKKWLDRHARLTPSQLLAVKHVTWGVFRKRKTNP